MAYEHSAEVSLQSWQVTPKSYLSMSQRPFFIQHCVSNWRRELCKRARKNGQQLFIATHNAPFLMGCVQAGVDLNIIRLTYRQGAATSRLLPTQQVVPL